MRLEVQGTYSLGKLLKLSPEELARGGVRWREALPAEGAVQATARRKHDEEPMTLWWMTGRPYQGSGWPPVQWSRFHGRV